MNYTTTMTSKGQITIPAALRKQLQLKPKDKVQYSMDESGVRIEKAQDPWEELHKVQVFAVAHAKKHSIKPLSGVELDNAINDAGEAAALERYERSLRS